MVVGLGMYPNQPVYRSADNAPERNRLRSALTGLQVKMREWRPTRGRDVQSDFHSRCVLLELPRGADALELPGHIQSAVGDRHGLLPYALRLAPRTTARAVKGRSPSRVRPCSWSSISSPTDLTPAGGGSATSITTPTSKSGSPIRLRGILSKSDRFSGLYSSSSGGADCVFSIEYQSVLRGGPHTAGYEGTVVAYYAYRPRVISEGSSGDFMLVRVGCVVRYDTHEIVVDMPA
ncbi:hypothetical protein B0H17DRAFT_303588 [Mycena rosella]|uniref:Uncharacterized protein n=1 Tax=Mycena rosella TaxID=1033263 RepID=A0AAD7G441_MYCRO|nr:hypothetical protein B0H17DRAFT_303588 [Mycena rosella]